MYCQIFLIYGQRNAKTNCQQDNQMNEPKGENYIPLDIQCMLGM